MSIEIKSISSSDEPSIAQAADLVSKYSWGVDYPINPIDEIRKSEYLIGAFRNEQLVGFGSVGRGFSPDNLNNDALWLAHAVVSPEYRGQGIFKKIYKTQMSYAESQQGQILSCTDNPIVKKFFLKNGWKKIRETKDEIGEPTIVFEYKK